MGLSLDALIGDLSELLASPWAGSNLTTEFPDYWRVT